MNTKYLIEKVKRISIFFNDINRLKDSVIKNFIISLILFIVTSIGISSSLNMDYSDSSGIYSFAFFYYIGIITEFYFVVTILLALRYYYLKYKLKNNLK